ncbi:MAG: hypothetical protein RLZZ387_5237, partial [Chloroflexota bacterium]
VATVASMIEDLAELPGIADDRRDPELVVALLRERKPDFVMLDGWKRLNEHETSRGTAQGRPRVKVTRVAEMLEVIQGS